MKIVDFDPLLTWHPFQPFEHDVNILVLLYIILFPTNYFLDGFDTDDALFKNGKMEFLLSFYELNEECFILVPISSQNVFNLS